MYILEQRGKKRSKIPRILFLRIFLNHMNNSVITLPFNCFNIFNFRRYIQKVNSEEFSGFFFNLRNKVIHGF